MKLAASMLSTLIAGNTNPVNNIDISDLVPGTYTLQFSVISIAPSPNVKIQIPPIVHAIITWKIEGQQQRRLVSVVSGASISGVAQGVDVKIIDDSDEDIGYTYQVQVTLSKGLRANTQQPPQLSRGRFVSINPTDQFKFSVPQDAGVISTFLYVDRGSFGTVADTDVEIRMLDAVGNIVANINPAPNGTQWIPLVPGTTEVSIVNFDATTGIFANLIWGIDG